MSRKNASLLIRYSGTDFFLDEIDNEINKMGQSRDLRSVAINLSQLLIRAQFTQEEIDTIAGHLVHYAWSSFKDADNEDAYDADYGTGA